MSDLKRIAARVATRYLARKSNFFEQDEPTALPPVTKALLEIERKVGGLPQILSGDRLINSSGLRLMDPAVRYWRNKAWAVITNVPNASGAQVVGLKIQKNLKGKKALTSADPYMHDIPLYVVAQDGTWKKIDPIPPKTRVRTGPSVSDEKRAVVTKGEAFFGKGGIRITGGGTRGYTLNIVAKKPEHKGLFRNTTTGAPTLEGLSAKLDEAIGKVERFLGR